MAKTPANPPKGHFEVTTDKYQFPLTLKRQIERGREILSFAMSIAVEKSFQTVEADYKTWNEFNYTFLESSFTDLRKKTSYGQVGLGISGDYVPLAERKRELTNDLTQKCRWLEGLYEQIELFKFPPDSLPTTSRTLETSSPDNKNVFLVHGHDHNTRDKVEIVLLRLGLFPIILSEQANQGDTIIEKLERESAKAAFAVIIATGDDEGYPKNKPELKRLRPRRNVDIEFGMFVGKLGRKRTVMLLDDGMDAPSDTSGMLYTILDPKGNWKLELARELKAAGFDVDLNKVRI